MFTLGSVGLAAVSVASAQTVLINDDFTSATRVGTPPSVTGVDRDGGSSRDYVVATDFNNDQAVSAVLDYPSNVGGGINGNSFL